MFYLNKNNVDFIRLNDILYNMYVIDENGNFIFPFRVGTLRYIDPEDQSIVVTPQIEDAVNNEFLSQSDRDFLISALSKKIWADE